ncbi:MAG: rhodanese-like domain-containing protein [Anaerolineales bacterium]|jgi:glyoxylase-like metal-dependent hydrolase (beta-lactamase superfamily II)/rhodanese-related sulfurtransferase
MYTQQFFVEGLGCASYIVGCEAEGVAAVIDPDRNVEKYLEAANARGLKITHIIETHLHADHVSGNTDLASRTDADIYLHEASGAEFDHKPLRDGDVLSLGNIRLKVVHTPGHTPESITLLISDTIRADEPWLALTGDTIFVGDIGRPDLVGAEAANGLATDMYTSLFEKLLPLDDSLLVYPGHGAGSLCGKSIGSMRSTTLGYERRYNAALVTRELDEFVAFATSDLPEQPGNHKRIKSLNRIGVKPLGKVESKPLSIQEAITHFQRGAGLLDTRSKADFVQVHIPGSVHLEADDQLSNRIGFVFPPDVPVILLLADPADYEKVVYSLARVGYDNVVGYLAEGLDVWEKMGLPVTSGDIKDIQPVELNDLLINGNGSRPVVVDVREPWEYRQGHIPGAVLMPLGQLATRVGELDLEKPVAVICATGNRSQSGSALLGQKGFKTVYNVVGGTTQWMRSGLQLERN